MFDSVKEIKSTSIRTYSGVYFDVFNPDPELILIDDIAHALSQLCRYGGHCDPFYCLSPDSRVLTANLEWIEIGNIKKEDVLFGFDEFAKTVGPGGGKRRRILPSKVISNETLIRPCYKMIMSDGTQIISSKEHLWLISTKKSHNQLWMTTEGISNDIQKGYKRYMLKIVEPWEKIFGYDVGYMAGVFDGEGHFCHSKGRGTTLGFGQKDNELLHNMFEIMKNHKINFRVFHNKKTEVNTCEIRGGWQQSLEVIGKIRANRLIRKFKEKFLTNQFSPCLDSIKTNEIESCTFIGNKEVCAIGTSTSTFITEGYPSHNSVAQHSIVCSHIVSDENKLCALLHDASEYVLCDIPKPIKKEISFYNDIEENLHVAIAKKFNLKYPHPEEVKKADNETFYNEWSYFMSKDLTEDVKLLQFYHRYFQPKSMQEVKQEFLDRFFYLTAKK